MGCASSKRVKASADVYHPAPSSFAVFDINAIKEPWLVTEAEHHEKPSPASQEPPPSHLPPTILRKLEATEEDDAPRSWDEVSEALKHHLQPTAVKRLPSVVPAHGPKADAATKPLTPLKSLSFHTLEELESKTKPETRVGDRQTDPHQLRKADSSQAGRTESNSNPTDSTRSESRPSSGGSYKPVTQNIFVVRDKLEREKEGKKKPAVSWDPLSEFPEKCPPGGAKCLVFYSTSLRGVRRTYDECERVRDILEQLGVAFDERDVALHGGFVSELRELLGEGVLPPRVFVKGRYLGGAEEVVRLSEAGRLGRVVRWARVERLDGSAGTCEGCGGVRFVPCLECGGSCKVRGEGGGKEWARCGECNENGLVRCPVCHK